jgi:hypothetical protein
MESMRRMSMKKIPGYEGYYATEDGQIISVRTGIERALSQKIHKGYLHVFIRKGIGRHTKVKIPVHQLVLMAFKGEKASPELVCRHLNGNPLINIPSNLEWGTSKENAMDSIRHGTAVCLRHGEENNASKLTKQQVIDIEHAIKSGALETTIAKQYGISQRHVSDIKLHRTWKFLWGTPGAGQIYTV